MINWRFGLGEKDTTPETTIPIASALRFRKIMRHDADSWYKDKAQRYTRANPLTLLSLSCAVARYTSLELAKPDSTARVLRARA